MLQMSMKVILLGLLISITSSHLFAMDSYSADSYEQQKQIDAAAEQEALFKIPEDRRDVW